MAFIQSIGLAEAPFAHKQSDILDFMVENVNIPEKDVDKIKRMYDRSEIATRRSAIEDFSISPADRKLFRSDKVSTKDRMQVFFEEAPKMCLKAVEESKAPLSKITHLITVSCTGLAAPGLDIILSEKLGLQANVHRTAINFMGCYAGFQALKTADAICAAHQNAEVLIVDVELCTIHFQNDFSFDNITSSLLFADGCAAVWVNNKPGIYSLEHFHTELAIKGKNDMTWHLGETGFLMTLSAYVPEIIAENIEDLLNRALSSSGKTKSEINHWAIHPGGKKILNEVSKSLSLQENDLDISRQVMKENGNMSSATIFFVLYEMLSAGLTSKDQIFAAGFGPGLTIESLLLEAC